MFRKKLALSLLVAGAGLVGAANSSRADFIPVLTGVSPTPVVNPGPYTYTYTVQLTDGEKAVAGTAPGDADYFTIYDFNFGTLSATTSNVTVAAGFAVSIQNVGITPNNLSNTSPEVPQGTGAFMDDPNIANLTFYKIGSDTFGPQFFTFTANSSIGLQTLDAYSSRGTLTTAPGAKDPKNGAVFVPDANGADLFSPTPAAAGAGVVLFGMLGSSRRRRKA